MDCLNIEEGEEIRDKAIKEILNRNPFAFDAKLIQSNNIVFYLKN